MTTVFRKANENDRNVEASLYIGNLDPKVTETILYELFVQFAPVRSLHLPKDRVLRAHQGFGFVEFKNPKDTEYVVSALKGVRLYGKLLRLRQLEAGKPSSTQPSKSVSTADVGAKIFVNNLNPLIDEKFLAETFSAFGTVIGSPQIVRDPQTGESKGHGFVDFDDFDSSDKAIESLNGKMLMNCLITVAYAFKGTNQKVRHGDKAERVLAANAKKRIQNSTPSDGTDGAGEGGRRKRGGLR
ncbi:hypothetical protein CANTEDRAFT_104351 [Yamadazyma tenuis ATCC 10573]|uniref:RRM domain-containing protein n=1 Tax=Candida tenuis (strain ATCC 10573 / BCRC 21748 / CBS 615 / JCM 9827 / NBRC 10315 / NRRL Y-1498 / VKM Y-70) TaxID=590646 RepID=G3B149_CANTC|nr:uncharacterized protein CANTEDRAFT_104351 [Yamadazyma tenuis ATCC 10573]EGV64878.1 hypothetical protein CANTEDRAFT_104351 [Yamadazyma tenuis ATCC 10573]